MSSRPARRRPPMGDAILSLVMKLLRAIGSTTRFQAGGSTAPARRPGSDGSHTHCGGDLEPRILAVRNSSQCLSNKGEPPGPRLSRRQFGSLPCDSFAFVAAASRGVGRLAGGARYSGLSDQSLVGGAFGGAVEARSLQMGRRCSVVGTARLLHLHTPALERSSGLYLPLGAQRVEVLRCRWNRL